MGQALGIVGLCSALDSSDALGNAADMLGGCSTAPAHDVHQAAGGEFGHQFAGGLRSLVVFAKGIR